MERGKQSFWLKAGVLSALLLVAGVAHAQFLRTSYFMEGSHYRMQLNPAMTPTRGYINIPVIGALNASVGSSSLGYQDIMDVIDDDGNFYNNPEFLGRLDKHESCEPEYKHRYSLRGMVSGEKFLVVQCRRTHGFRREAH